MNNVEKQFVCERCNRTFKSKKAVAQHLTWCGTGKKNPVGRKCTAETKRKISIANTKYNRSDIVCKSRDERLIKLRAYHKTRILPRKEVSCEHCGTVFVCKEKENRRYCSQSCANGYTNLHVPREQRSCLLCGKEFVVRVTSTQKYCNLDCSATNARSKRKHFPGDFDVREKISKSVAEAYINGKFNPSWYFKQEWVTSDKFGKTLYSRSSYETKAIEILETIPGVYDIDHEKLRIPYIGKEGFVKNFVPDFHLETKIGPIILEIKPKEFVGKRQNQLKYHAARQYAKEHKMLFLIWTEPFLFPTNNGSTTAISLQEIVKDTATTLQDGKVKVQSELYSSFSNEVKVERQAEMTCPPMEVAYA